MGIFDSDTKEGEEEFKEIFEVMQRNLWKMFIKEYKSGIRMAKSIMNPREMEKEVEVFSEFLSTNPLATPGRFGYGLGLFFGILHYKTSLLLIDLCWRGRVGYYFKYAIAHLKSVKGFDFGIVKKRVKRIDSATLRGLNVNQMRNLKELISHL